jgi:hypothetical protein
MNEKFKTQISNTIRQLKSLINKTIGLIELDPSLFLFIIFFVFIIDKFQMIDYKHREIKKKKTKFLLQDY